MDYYYGMDELIDTQWDVNIVIVSAEDPNEDELIDTQWDVNYVTVGVICAAS